ncbi:uncharacterized protein LOC144319096 isoform X2 [Canis aureus]
MNNTTVPKKDLEMAEGLGPIQKPVLLKGMRVTPCPRRSQRKIRIVSDLKASWNSNNLAVQRTYLEKMSDLPNGQSVSPSNPVPCALSLLVSP